MVTEPTDEEDGVIADHFRYLKDGAERGVVLLAGRTLDADSFGIVIFEADDDDGAEAFMTADPAVRGNVMDAAVFPYRVAIGGTIGEG
jgi:uncharacterized protein YciI